MAATEKPFIKETDEVHGKELMKETISTGREFLE